MPHKEEVQRALPKSIGVEISERPRRTRVVEEKMKQAVLASEAVQFLDTAWVHQIDGLLGLWTWVVFVAKSALSIPDTIYTWVRLHRGQAKCRKEVVTIDSCICMLCSIILSGAAISYTNITAFVLVHMQPE